MTPPTASPFVRDRIAPATPYLPYHPEIETIPPDEDETIAAITQSLGTVTRLLADRYRHAVRPSHAKSHGLLRGELQVLPGLPHPFGQGLFAQPCSYPVVARLSTEPGELMADSIHTPRGFAVKVIGVVGEMLPGHEGEVTQDFLFSSGRRFAVGDLKGFLAVQRFLEGIANQPEGVKKAGTALGFAANGVLRLVGSESAFLDFFGHPHTHPLGETYQTHAPLRHGAYVGKLALAPVSQTLKALEHRTIEPAFRYSALKEEVVQFFREQEAEYELRVQLRTDEAAMPIEDASVEWPEALSPFLPVARVFFPPQDAYGPARRAFMDDALSFSPAHSLTAHRPLGSLMRGRLKAYGATAALRAGLNARPRVEPRRIDEIPD